MARPPKKYSINKIAEEAEVSVFSVSCVLNNRPGVSEETRSRIKKILDKVNYKRNYKLKSNRTIGLVLPGIFDDWYISALIRGVMTYTSEKDIDIATIIRQPENNKSLLVVLRKHNFHSAVIAMPGHMNMLDEIRSVVKKTEIPFILMDFRLHDFNLDEKNIGKIGFVDNNSYQGCNEITKYLLDLGHQRIAFVARKLAWEDNNQYARVKGWREAMAEAGLSDEMFFCIDPEEMNTIPFKEENITAVVCTDDYMAMSCLSYCYEQNIRIPDDMSVVGFGNMNISSQFSPPLTTVDQKAEKVGYQAIKYAAELATGKIDEIPQKVISTNLVIRKSSGKVKE